MEDVKTTREGDIDISIDDPLSISSQNDPKNKTKSIILTWDLVLFHKNKTNSSSLYGGC